jgi:iron complex outermembrane receptor protein
MGGNTGRSDCVGFVSSRKRTTFDQRQGWCTTHGQGRSKGTDMKYKTQLLSNLLATTVICGAIGFATPAFAADTQPAQPQADQPAPTTGPAAGQPADQGEAIVVTGTRIPTPNLSGTSPVTVINSAEVRLQGTTRTEDLINSLPQAFAGQGGNLANGATGTATVDLRDLGPSRTLVLINGRRLQAGDPAQNVPVPDINFIPAALVSRVDVLTGGASSVYGADAVAGVVNFIMDTQFTGFRADAQYSFYQHENSTNNQVIQELNRRNFGYPRGNVADGGTYDLSLALGAAFDDGRGHVMAYATYRQLDAVLQGRRDYSACALTAQTRAQVTATPSRLYSCGGSGTSANGTFFTNVGTFQVGPNRTFIPGSTPFNFAPYNYFQRPDERYTAGAFADYEINEALHPFLEAMFMDDRSVAQIAPSGDFGNTFTINCDNPLLSAQQRAIVCSPGNLITANGSTVNQAPAGRPPQAFIDQNGNPYFRGALQPLRRNVEGGGRQADLQHTDYRIVAGMRGDLGGGFSYEMYYQYGRVVYAQTYLNDFSVVRLGRALDVVTGPGGVPTCRSVLDGSDANCVPYDIFGTGGVTPGALSYLQTPGFARGNTQETVANANITADLGHYGLQSPWSEEGFGLNFGVEYRKESLTLDTDTEFSTGDLAGQGGATLGVSGSFDVREAFIEARLPIADHRAFAYELSLGAGYRYSHYQVPGTAANPNGNSFNTDTYKFEGAWAPIRDIRFRASYNRAVRAPNVAELFVSQSVALDGATDPCAGAAIGGLIGGTGGPNAAQCARTGVSAAQFGNIVANQAAQYNGLLGGNPLLTPEIATTWTAGVVIQPSIIPGLALTVDWFNIKVKNQIGTIGADLILQQCITDNTYCNLIHRDAQGSLWRSPNGFVVDTNLNAGELSTRGVDFGFSYTHGLGGIGSLNLNSVGTWLDQLIVDPVGSARYDCTGYEGVTCGTPAPEWRFKTRLTLTTPEGIGLSLQWRYFSSVQRDSISKDPGLGGANGGPTNCRPADCRIGAQNYFDLTMTARIGDHYNFRIGVNNVLDREPPLATQLPGVVGSGNTYPQVYDAMGRYIFAGVTLDF